MDIDVKIITADEQLIPGRQTELSAGYDLRAAVDAPVTLKAGERKLISTGLKMEIPAGYEGQVRPRSGLAIKHGITMLNAPGTIDADYRGDVGIILFNAGNEDFTINRGDRIAQIIFAPVQTARFDLQEKLSESGRGSGGFGSTGV